MLAVRAARTGAQVCTVAPERVGLVAFERELDPALVEDILEGGLDVVGESGAVTDGVQALLRLGGGALSALGVGSA